MAVISQPNLLPGEFASDGDKNTIPANNDGLSGLASIAKGFPPITQQPLASGGLPPQRADFNGIFNLISQFLLYYQSGGVCSYNTTLDYNPPAIVGDAEGNIYECIAQNGPNTSAGEQDIRNTSYWAKVINIKTLETKLQDYALTSNLDSYLLLSGGTVTGDLLAPTPSINDNSKKVATTEFVKSLFTAKTTIPGWSKNDITGIVRQWGTVTYNSSPNQQIITPPLSFSKLLNCGATDVGWENGTGNTFANMDFSEGNLYIRPVYGNNEAALNGVILRWWIECLL